MPVRVGGVRPGLTDDQLLDRLDDVWAEAVVLAKDAQRLTRRIAKQDAWLDANRDDPRWVRRCDEWRLAKANLDRMEISMRALANSANKLTEPMGTKLRKQAVDRIHVWAGLGGVGIYADFFDIIPNAIWFQTAAAQAEEADRASGFDRVPF